MISQNSSVLSYGCGLGYVEKELLRFRPDLSLTAFDFADTAGKWIKRDLPSIKYTQNIEDESKYGFIYSRVLYALSLSDSINLLKFSKKLSKDGKLLLIHHSLKYEENIGTKSIIREMKEFIRPIYRYIFPIRKLQFWGWWRNNKLYIEIAKVSGLKPVQIFSKVNTALLFLVNKNYSVN